MTGSEWKRINSWKAALALVLLVSGLTTVALAADELEWPGTTPENISASVWDRAWQPSMAAGDTGRMVVAWSDESVDHDRNISAVDSSDNGRSWSSPQVVAEDADRPLLLPGTAVAEGRSFVSWSRQSSSPGGYVFHVYETELGTGVERQVPGSLGYDWPSWPRLAEDGNQLHMVFHGADHAPNILYTSRFLTDTDWLTAAVVYTHTGAIGSFYPALAVEPGEDKLHLVWEERAGNLDRKVLYMEGDASGPTVNWSPAVTLSTGITLSVWPSVVASSAGDVYVVWGEQVGTGDVADREHYVRFSHRDSSGVWSTPKRIDAEPVQVNHLIPTAVTLSMALLEDDGHVRFCVAWHGFRQGDNDAAEEVVVSCSTNQGATWTSPQNMSRTSGSEATSIVPAIVFDGADELHGVWQERAGGDAVFDYQIYHTRRLDKRVYLPLMMRRN